MFVISDVANTLFPMTVGSLFTNTVKQAIATQAQFGIHYASTGEKVVTKSLNMAVPFLHAFNGIEFREDETVITDQLSVKPQAEVEKLDILEEFRQAKKEIDNLVDSGKYREFKALKISISNIDVLMRFVVDDTNTPPDVLLSTFADGLELIAKVAVSEGCRYISFDMPFWTRSNLYRTEILRVSKALFSQLKAIVPEDTVLAVHSCYRHTDETIETLWDLPIDLLDLEFAHYPENFAVIKNENFAQYGKSIKVGVVTRGKQFVETEQEIRKHVTQILSTYDSPYLLFGPDCAMSGLPKNTGLGKLNMLKMARNIAFEILDLPPEV